MIFADLPEALAKVLAPSLFLPYVVHDPYNAGKENIHERTHTEEP